MPHPRGEENDDDGREVVNDLLAFFACVFGALRLRCGCVLGALDILILSVITKSYLRFARVGIQRNRFEIQPRWL